MYFISCIVNIDYDALAMISDFAGIQEHRDIVFTWKWDSGLKTNRKISSSTKPEKVDTTWKPYRRKEGTLSYIYL